MWLFQIKATGGRDGTRGPTPHTTTMIDQATTFKACLQQHSSSKQPHPPQLHLSMSSQMLTPLMNKIADNASLLVMWLSPKTMPASSSCDCLWRHPLSQILPGKCTTNLLGVSESPLDWYHSSDHHVTHGTGIASENTHTNALGFSVFLGVCLVTCLHKYCLTQSVNWRKQDTIKPQQPGLVL